MWSSWAWHFALDEKNRQRCQTVQFHFMSSINSFYTAPIYYAKKSAKRLRDFSHKCSAKADFCFLMDSLQNCFLDNFSTLSSTKSHHQFFSMFSISQYTISNLFQAPEAWKAYSISLISLEVLSLWIELASLNYACDCVYNPVTLCQWHVSQPNMITKRFLDLMIKHWTHKI